MYVITYIYICISYDLKILFLEFPTFDYSAHRIRLIFLVCFPFCDFGKGLSFYLCVYIHIHRYVYICLCVCIIVDIFTCMHV